MLWVTAAVTICVVVVLIARRPANVVPKTETAAPVIRHSEMNSEAAAQAVASPGIPTALGRLQSPAPPSREAMESSERAAQSAARAASDAAAKFNTLD